MEGRTAIVTGSGGGGSGRAIARRFAREGAAVVVSDINEDGGRETVALIEAEGGRGAFWRADVRDKEEVRDLVRFAETEFGGLDVLVNNASDTNIRPDIPLELWDEAVDTELLGTMHAIRAAVEAMRRRGGGAIVNMASITGLWHGRDATLPAYDTAKAAVIRLTTALGFLAEREKIRVNCLAPGWIAAPQVESYWQSLTPEQRKERGVPSRLLTLEEVASAVFGLATDESLHGRVLAWWSEDEPLLIPWADRGYAGAAPYRID